MISRKRETEKAILAAFEAYAAAVLTGVQTARSRRAKDLDKPLVQVVCNRQVPDGSLDEYNVFVTIEGAIVITDIITNADPTEIETLEAYAENFLETKTDDLLDLINPESDTVQLADIQPGESEDGFDSETNRYVSRYTFSANVYDLTDT